VFASILANATKLCAAHFGMLALHEDGAFRSVAMHNVPQAFAEQRLSGPIRFAPKNPLGRLAATKAVEHVVDVRTDPAFLDGEPGLTALARLTGARTLLVVPMSRTTTWSAPSASTARKCALSATSRSTSSGISPIRPSSPSRIRDC
jgi:hypothetical protein